MHKLGYGKLYCYSKSEHLNTMSIADKEKKCKFLLAGICAQKELSGTYSPSYRAEDKKAAFDIALEIALDGLTLEALSKTRQDAVREEAEKMLLKFDREVMQLLQQHKASLIAIISGLETKKTLYSKDVSDLCY